MTKNFLQDIVPPKRSIRNIPLPDSRVRVKEEEQKSHPDIIEKNPEEESVILDDSTPSSKPPKTERPTEESEKYKYNNLYKKRRSPTKIIFFGIIIAVIIFIAITAFSFFSGATVTIVPKKSSVTLSNELLLASSDQTSVNGGLVFKIKEVTSEQSLNVDANGEEEVETKASGIITIYNEYTENAQPLVKNTRFESNDGKIYRIQNSISVPGKKSDGTPGTIDVEVFADEAGESYNLEQSVFTIPGFKDHPQYDNFYAKTKTAIDGGFKGVRKIVSDSDKADAEIKLKEKILADIKEQLKNSESDQSISLYTESDIKFSSIKQEDGGGNSITIKLIGTLEVLVFDKSDFSNSLATESLTVFNPEDNVSLEESSTISVELVEDTEEQSSTQKTVSVSGQASFVWINDTELLKQKLSGTSKKELKSVLQDFSGIAKVEAKIVPFWNSKFPENIDKIDVVVEME